MAAQHADRRVYERARDAVLGGSCARGAGVRPEVRASWARSLAAAVDPERSRPPHDYDRAELTDRRAAHPLASVLPVLRDTLTDAAEQARHMMIVTDGQGRILWREGARAVLTRAERVDLVEGTRWSEDAVGTNAMGTALAGAAPVRIHSAEHLVSAYHPWTCAAAPVHDPATGRVVGTVDVTGPEESFHPTTLALVTAERSGAFQLSADTPALVAEVLVRLRRQRRAHESALLQATELKIKTMREVELPPYVDAEWAAVVGQLLGNPADQEPSLRFLVAEALRPEASSPGSARRERLWTSYSQALRTLLGERQIASSGAFPAERRWFCFDGGDAYETALSVLALQVAQEGAPDR